MGARSEAVAATRRRILEAGLSLGFEDLNLDPTLEEVAHRAGVSVQTVLRHFGSRAALLAAVADSGRTRVEAELRPATRDAAVAVDAVLAHYARLGDFFLAVLAREHGDARFARVTEMGKAVHRRWVEDCFGADLPAEPGSHEAHVDLLMVATDVCTWKQLRRDLGRSDHVVRERMLAMVQALLATAG